MQPLIVGLVSQDFIFPDHLIDVLILCGFLSRAAFLVTSDNNDRSLCAKGRYG